MNIYASEQMLNDEYLQSCFIDKSKVDEAGIFIVHESKQMGFVKGILENGILDDTGQFFEFDKVQLISKKY